MKLPKSGDEIYVKRCKHCGRNLAYTDYDLLVGKKDLKFYIKCMCCGELLRVGVFRKEYNPEKHGKLIINERKELWR